MAAAKRAPERDTMTLAETSRRSGIGRKKLAELIDRGEFPGYHYGDRYVIPIRGYERWLECHEWKEEAA